MREHAAGRRTLAGVGSCVSILCWSKYFKYLILAFKKMFDLDCLQTFETMFDTFVFLDL